MQNKVSDFPRIVQSWRQELEEEIISELYFIFSIAYAFSLSLISTLYFFHPTDMGRGK